MWQQLQQLCPAKCFLFINRMHLQSNVLTQSSSTVASLLVHSFVLKVEKKNEIVIICRFLSHDFTVSVRLSLYGL